MIKVRGLHVIVGAFVTTALFAACAPDLKTSTGEGGAGSWAESSAASSSSGQNSSSSSSASSSSGNFDPTCSDMVKNGNETDTDCGGSKCPKCAAGQMCFSDLDCISNFCGANDICAPAASCMDSAQNGNETDVDCGGADCGACSNGSKCQVNSDCQSSTCIGGSCTNPLVFIGATVLNVQNSFTMAVPNGVQINDLLVMFIAHGGGGTTAGPSMGWTTLENGSNPNNDPRLDIYYQIYSATTSFAFSFEGSDGSAILAAFRGVNFGTIGTLQNSWSDMITTSQASTLVFASLQNGGGEIPALPPGFTSIGIGNGNMRSLQVGYLTAQPADAYVLTAVAGAGEILPSGSVALALY
jgi:hypothetical protein